MGHWRGTTASGELVRSANRGLALVKPDGTLDVWPVGVVDIVRISPDRKRVAYIEGGRFTGTISVREVATGRVLTTPALDALSKAAKAGIVVVRSTRLPSGITLRNNEVNDDEKGFVASGELNPPKSRVLLQLALTKTNDPVQIQRMFYEY